MSDRSTTYPYDTIAYIAVTYVTLTAQGPVTSSGHGSGVLISPDEVLTASHVVYQQGIGTASSIVVAPGYDGGSTPFGRVAGTASSYYPVADANDLISAADSQMDYAVIHLASPIWTVGSMMIQPDYPGGPVNVTGYPGPAGGPQVTAPQYVTRNPYFSLLDGQQLGKGSSGGPVWIDAAAGPMVVGVVSSGSDTTGAGRNALITSAALRGISATVALDDARLHAVATLDANGDGYSDLTWRSQGGTILQWDITGNAVAAKGEMATVDPSSSFLAIGDFGGLGRSAMLWRDTSGLVDEWQMNGTTVVSITPVGLLGLDWHALATGAFSGSGKSGLLLQQGTGPVVAWQMDGPNVLGAANVGTLDASWRFITAGHLEGVGTADAVWQNASGTIEAWQISRGAIVGASVIGALDSSWKFLAAGDFNGDGSTDLMWQAADGGITEWAMNGSSIIGAGFVSFVTPGDVSVVGTGDYNRDGHSDLMLRSGSGMISEWVMNGSTILGASDVATLDANWTPLT